MKEDAVRRLRCIGLAPLLALAGCASSVPPIAADLIVEHARIVTLDARSSVAEALAVRDGRIVAVGSSAQVERFAGPATTRIDAGGRTVVPGLIDSHIHAVRAALTFSTEVNWIGARSIDEALQRVRDAVLQGPPGRWIVVAGGWSEAQFAEKRRPTQAELTAAAPDNPVYIQLFYRSVLLTPKAMRALGATPEAAPPRLVAERDEAGRGTGWFSGDITSISPLFDKLPKPGYADNVAGTKRFMAELNRLAITGVVDPGGFSLAPAQYAPLFELWRGHQLSVRVRYALFSQGAGSELQDFKALTQMLPMGLGDDMLRFNGIGERVTTAMYNNNAPDEATKERFYEVIRWAAGRGLGLTIHWQENASVDQLLALFERVDREVPIAPLRWSIAHLDDASPETLRRLAALGVGWTMQDYMYFSGDRELAARPDEARRMPPIVDALAARVHVGAGTDAHRVASYNPFTALQWMLDGRTVSGATTRGPEQTPSREQALRLYTLGSAWFSFEENERGSLEPGKLADFALLDRDYFSVPVEQIGGTVSLLTVVGGKIVYAAAPFGGH
jgi:predicted amidohydrolase YtcJ